jgi:capsular polysaccharide biosynthesis protein
MCACVIILVQYKSVIHTQSVYSKTVSRVKDHWSKLMMLSDIHIAIVTPSHILRVSLTKSTRVYQRENNMQNLYNLNFYTVLSPPSRSTLVVSYIHVVVCPFRGVAFHYP